MARLQPRHGHVVAPEGGYLVHHWGYGYEPLPCSSDLDTCKYLDAVYVMHDLSMKYSFIMWGVILGILAVWVFVRGWRMGGPSFRIGGIIDEACERAERLKRKWLLKDAPLASIFGRTTRLQVTILAILLGYLLIFSFTGFIWLYSEPVKRPGKTRTTLGFWSNRVGILAYALTPFTVLLASRESILTLVTGIPYQHFNFLHRACGRIIFAQAMLHTIGWTVVEAYYYKPSPDVYNLFLTNMYAIFGCVATALICFLTVFSLKPVIRWTGYEFFRITHSVGALLYIGACWGHWDKLWCWMVASITLIALDQGVRIGRTCYLHFGGRKGKLGFRRAMANVQMIGEGDDMVIRLDFDFGQEAWEPGQHFYLCFPDLSIWQSHPFTVCSTPNYSGKTQHHTYLFRARRGQTSQLAALTGRDDVAVIMSGPYGHGWPRTTIDNVLTVAGGTGVTFTLPIAIASLRQYVFPQTTVDFVWIVRHAQDLLWLSGELTKLKEMLVKNPGLRVSIFVTREDAPGIPSPYHEADSCSQAKQDLEKGFTISTAASSVEQSSATKLQELLATGQERFHVEMMGGQHPGMEAVVNSLMERAGQRGGSIQIVGSGPESMGSDLRATVSQVDTQESLDFYWDSRE